MDSITEAQELVTVEVTIPAVREGFAILNIVKIWGGLELLHRGSKMFGGMTWVPDGQLPVGIKVNESILNPDQVAVLFKDLLSTLMPSVEVFVNTIDGDEF